MKRSRLPNKFLKEKILDARIAYYKQSNYCKSLLQRTKKTFFFNININLVTDKRKFWKTVKHFYLT